MDSSIAVELHPDHDYEPSPINDIGLSGEELLMKTTRELNNYLKKNNIPKERRKEIKHERRTLKNRGYAASYRKKTDHDSMSSLNVKLKDKIECMWSQIEESKREREQLRIQKLLITKECEQLEWDQKHGKVSKLYSWDPPKLKGGEVAATTASLPTKNLPWRPWSEYSKRKK